MQRRAFSLTHGMLLYGLLRRPELRRWRVVLLPAVAWVPLLILSAVEGVAVGQRVWVPFLPEFAVHIRLLLGLPLLILAERLIEHWCSRVIEEFPQNGLIPPDELPRFQQLVSRVQRALNSWLVGLFLLVLAYIGAFSHWGMARLEVTTWWSHPGLAGWWLKWVASPIYQYAALRWLWWFLCWCGFLWKVAGLQLKLIASHPDRRGGLAFVNVGHARFALVLLALSAVASAQLGERMLFGGATLSSLKAVLIGIVIVSLLVMLTPLLVFTPQLLRTKNLGLVTFGSFALKYTRSFQEKWLAGSPPEGESLLGTQDLQALADLGGSFEVVQQMRVVMWGRQLIAAYVVAVVLPMIPLLIAEVPVTEVLKGVLKLVG